MPEWKQWHVLGNGEFPALQGLSIEDCPKLMGKLPENLCSLTELIISSCPELNLEMPIQLSSLKKFEVDGSPKAGVLFDEAELFTSQVKGMKQIEQLCISDCNSLTSLPTSTGLTLESCESIPWGRYLYVNSCQNLTSFFIPNGTEKLEINCCENLEILSVARGTQMTSLFIYECKKLKRLPERMQELLPSLKLLQLWNCPEIESFPDGGLPFNLQVLQIRNCEKLENGRKEWRLQRLPSLSHLEIYFNGSDEEIVGGEIWELPCSIRSLTIENLKTLSSQVLNSLTSLESLEYLSLWNHHELYSLPTEGLRHLTSLQSLHISNCHKLQSLAESGFPSSLSELIIDHCPNLHSLPVKGLPSSLSKLSITRCPLLEPLLEFDKGEYWPEIAHIPQIYIGDTEIAYIPQIYMDATKIAHIPQIYIGVTTVDDPEYIDDPKCL